MTDAILRLTTRTLGRAREWIRELARYVAYQRRRRAQATKAKRDDSNIYPLW